MINSYKELLQETLAKYEHVKFLSRDGGLCLYGDKANGVGCGIGCHLPAWFGDQLDHLDTSNIANIIRDRPHETLLIKQYINVDAIGVNLLVEMQVAHDTATSVAKYRKWMKEQLIFLEWQEERAKEEVKTDKLELVYA